jgi:hypothetical protein
MYTRLHVNYPLLLSNVFIIKFSPTDNRIVSKYPFYEYPSTGSACVSVSVFVQVIDVCDYVCVCRFVFLCRFGFCLYVYVCMYVYSCVCV